MLRAARYGAVHALSVTLTVFVLMMAASGISHAMSVTPLSLELTSSGGRDQVAVTNDNDSPLPVEVTVQTLSVDENGENALKAGGDEEFVIFPQQALIPPGGTQMFRVQWVGEPLLTESRSFIVSFDQIPVRMRLEKGQIGAQTVYGFGVVVNVAPPEGQPDLKVVATGVASGKDGKRHPQITVENASKTHGLLSQANIEVAAGNWSARMSAFEVRNNVGIGLVQPGKRRKFLLPVEVPAGAANVQVRLDPQPKR